MAKHFEIFADGACRGNPGPAGIGVVIKQNGKIIKKLSLAIGEATNNIAEYMAVVFALQEALMLNADQVMLYSDSELFCNQFRGSYQVKNPNIRPLFHIINHLKPAFQKLEVQHILRDKNAEADKLAKKSIIEQVKMVAFRNSSETQMDFGQNLDGGRKVRAPKDNAPC